jgi:hypothetical protein
MGEHQWGQAFEGAKHCINVGCEVRLSFSGRWQLRPGTRWVSPTRRPLPVCMGAPSAAEAQCTHVERPVGTRCQRPALPGLVVCEHHATPEALRPVIVGMAAEIERLTQLSGGSSDNS